MYMFGPSNPLGSVFDFTLRGGRTSPSPRLSDTRELVTVETKDPTSWVFLDRPSTRRHANQSDSVSTKYSFRVSLSHSFVDYPCLGCLYGSYWVYPTPNCELLVSCNLRCDTDPDQILKTRYRVGTPSRLWRVYWLQRKRVDPIANLSRYFNSWLISPLTTKDMWCQSPYFKCGQNDRTSPSKMVKGNPISYPPDLLLV